MWILSIKKIWYKNFCRFKPVRVKTNQGTVPPNECERMWDQFVIFFSLSVCAKRSWIMLHIAWPVSHRRHVACLEEEPFCTKMCCQLIIQEPQVAESRNQSDEFSAIIINSWKPRHFTKSWGHCLISGNLVSMLRSRVQSRFVAGQALSFRHIFIPFFDQSGYQSE